MVNLKNFKDKYEWAESNTFFKKRFETYIIVNDDNVTYTMKNLEKGTSDIRQMTLDECEFRDGTKVIRLDGNGINIPFINQKGEIYEKWRKISDVETVIVSNSENNKKTAIKRVSVD